MRTVIEPYQINKSEITEYYKNVNYTRSKIVGIILLVAILYFKIIYK